MTTLITRLYATQQLAEKAAAALAADGFQDKHFTVISAPTGKKATKADLGSISDALSSAGVIPRSAGIYAPLIAEGNALLAVRAPVGAAFRAKDTLAPFDAIDTGARDEVHLPAEVYRPMRMHRPSATSLLARDAMILSGRRFMRPLTSSSRPISEMLGFPMLSKKGPRANLSSFSLSKMFGLPLLSKR